jgi:alpha-1,3/alpha-1,6-mannosyltransferase
MRLAPSQRARLTRAPPDRTQNEHFGLVPLEAMAAQRPVVACASGGPKESVVHGVTGFLCDPTPASFAAAAQSLLEDPAGAWFTPLQCRHPADPACLSTPGIAAAERAGVAARQHVETHFSRAAFGAKLDALVRELAA